MAAKERGGDCGGVSSGTAALDTMMIVFFFFCTWDSLFVVLICIAGVEAAAWLFLALDNGRFNQVFFLCWIIFNVLKQVKVESGFLACSCFLACMRIDPALQTVPEFNCADLPNAPLLWSDHWSGIIGDLIISRYHRRHRCTRYASKVSQEKGKR